MEKIRILITTALFMFPLSQTGALDSQEIPALHLFRPSPRLGLTVMLKTPEGNSVSVRRLEILSDAGEGGLKLRAAVLEPASLRNMKFLRIEQKDSVQMWLKTSRGVRRLGLGSRPEPLFGSVFTTADFDLNPRGWSKAGVSGASHKYERMITDPDGRSLKQVAEVRMADWVVVSVLTYNAEGRLLKTYVVKEWDAQGETFGFPKVVEIRLAEDGRYSSLEILSSKEPEVWPANTFSSGSL